jgi:hypothetical protein
MRTPEQVVELLFVLFMLLVWCVRACVGNNVCGVWMDGGGGGGGGFGAIGVCMWGGVGVNCYI